MTIQLKNNATGFLTAGVSASATLLVLQAGDGANFPTLVPSQFFYVTLVSPSGAIEVVKVTGRSGDSLTVQRAQEGSTAMSFPALSRVELRVTAQAVYDVIDAAISGTTTAVSNIASVIAVAASIDSVNTVTSNLASVINVSNNIGDINLVENSLTNVNLVAANMADVNAVADDLAAVNAVADDIDELVTNLEDIVAVGGNINSVVTVANNIASVNAVNSNSTNVNTVAGSIGNVNTVATNIAAVQTVSTNIANVNAVNSNSANVNTVAGSIANVNTTATNIASVNTAATNIVAIQTAPAQATAAANSASAAATSATNAANSATAAAASATTALNAPGTSGTSTTSLTIGTGSRTITTQTAKAWVVGQFVTVASTASPTNFMHGQITAYNSGTGSMTVNVLAVGGSGTLASWTIGLTGPNATLTDQNSLQPVALTLPSIRPSLLLDFANSKKLDPRITFSRATGGTYYDGVTTSKAEENVLLRSQDYSATWTAASLTPVTGRTAPDGTATGTEFTASGANGTLTQSVTAIAADYTFSVWLRRVTGSGNIDISAHSGGTWVTQTITSSWARYTVTQTLTAGTRTPGIRIVTSGDVIEVWGAQLEQRSAATAYTPTTTQAVVNYIPTLRTAPAGVPRFDHNPVTGESLGLLVEEQRTNIWLNSEAFSSGGSGVSATYQNNTVIAPNGSLTACKLVSNASNTLHGAGGTFSLSASTSYVLTIYAKAEKWSRVAVRGWYDGTSYRLPHTTVDLVTKQVLQAGTTPVISDAGNGWLRISFPFSTSGALNATVVIEAHNTTTAQDNEQGDGYSGIFIWGAQLEVGAFPTSYIPTGAAAVTRTADDVSMTGANFSSWYRQNQGSWLFDYRWAGGTAGNYAFTIGSAGTDMFYGYGGGNAQLQVFTNSTLVANLYAGAFASNAYNKVSFAYATNDFAVSLNASAAATDTSGNVPVADKLQLGRGGYGSPYPSNNHYRKLAYYPKRLTNAELQALTA